jgi:hypothetical protein
MDATRRVELETSLQRELARQAAEQDLDPTGRAAWLLDQLENYVHRWMGMRAAVGDDLFIMIEACAAAISRELSSVDSPNIDTHWQAFLAVLDEGRRGVLGEPGKLVDSLAVVRAQLVS